MARRATTAFPLALLALAGCDGAVHYLGADCLPSGSDRDLQAAMDQRSTLLLCPRAVFTLNAPVILPAALTMQTAGTPSNPDDMATIRLAATFPTPRGAAVTTSGGDVHLAAVRFDGNRRALGDRQPLGLVELGPGDGYRVEGCAFTDAPGWTHLHLLEPCDGATVTDNVVESAPRPHVTGATLTDGLSISCAHSQIARNQINDVSAVGIVYFGGAGTAIRDNVIRETNTSAYSGINLGDAVVADHTGVTVEGNQIVATDPRFVHVGIAAGLHVFAKTAMISGISVTGNRIEGMSRYGLAVDGCTGCTVDANTFDNWHPVPPLDACPASADYIAALSVAHAGGDLQPGFSDQKIDSCLGEPDVLGPIYRGYAGNVPFPEYLAFEVQVVSLRLQHGLDAITMLHAEWDDVATRAKTICPDGDDGAQKEVWRRIAEVQYGKGLSAAEADAQVRAELPGTSAGAACGL